MNTPAPKTPTPAVHTLASPGGLRARLLSHGALCRLDAHGVMVNLFAGHETEGGPANLWLRQWGPDGRRTQATPLLGPWSPLAWPLPSAEAAQVAPPGTAADAAPPPAAPSRISASGTWQGLHLRLDLCLADSPGTINTGNTRTDTHAWFWHLGLHNPTEQTQTLDLLLVQDIGLAPYDSARLNEYYVSHYLDLSPLAHARHGTLLAARQNQPVDGRHPWALVGSLRRATRWATDAQQVLGLAARAGGLPLGVQQGLPAARLQAEHALLALQDDAFTLAPGGRLQAGFFGLVRADHPAATADSDTTWADTALALAAAQPPQAAPEPGADAAAPSAPAHTRATLLARAPMLPVQDLLPGELATLFGTERRHVERDTDGSLLSFFCDQHTHVVLRTKELRVARPHGHILRSGAGLVPDETALTSTVWMGGVFHSMVTQGHVSINRLLSTQRGLLGQFRGLGQRVLVHTGGTWQLLGLPSAWSLQPDGCRWLYRHAEGLLEVRSTVQHDPHALTLDLQVLEGPPLPLCLTQHIALGGDDGSAAAPVPWQPRDGGVWVAPPVGSELAARFPGGGFALLPAPGTVFTAIGGDELLAADGRPAGQPYVCLQATAAPRVGLRILGRLLPQGDGCAASVPPATAATTATTPALPLPRWSAPPASPLAAAARQLADITPWLAHNALVHYLAPRGLEQFSGGGWGTRDVCQGPLEMLLALGRHAPVRDLLLRVFAAQEVSGDWPQWFMFFERDRHIRAGDSHGDIVFWPLLGLARYLLASGDLALLDEPVPYHAAADAVAEVAPLWQHLQRALAVTQARRIPGTHLAAYGHGDWNDSLQPADPALREHLCSAWTVTLHHQVLHTLADALESGHPAARDDSRTAVLAQTLRADAAAVRTDFQRLLVADGVVAGYALFAPEDGPSARGEGPQAGSEARPAAAPPGSAPQLLLHPQDTLTGVRYSLLPMMHAILDNLLSPAQAAQQLRLVQEHLTGPDGARLFDRPLPYRGGPMTLFQRAESSAFFGREIGVMYMHAHLRWAETLAHLGLADAFFAALSQAHPIALRQRVPTASLRQANCYYSSSDAAFADRYEAQAHYGRIASGRVALDGGWRIYSSGPGIALGLIQGVFLGVRPQARCLVLDPVLPPALSGLQAEVDIAGHPVQLELRTGPAGCGPLWMELNGAPLPFGRGHNPYRCGPAEVAWPELLARLQGRDGVQRLVVHLG